MTNAAFTDARNFTLPRDPLVLDLDGDGLELKPASGILLFDHDADGIKTGTGWASADDGFLVRDLDGNGQIDSGRELFGEDTLKRNGQTSTQGFDALADLDSNADGEITNADAAWSQLQVWRDLNQDGISQSGELFTLDALNITRLGAKGSTSGPQAGQTLNNNRVALSTTFSRNGANRTVGAIDLDANPFFSDIPPERADETGYPVTLTEAALALPQMNGSGMVRNLRASMSSSGAAADELEAALGAFATAPTRDAQLALLDKLITEWAQTSSYWNELEGYLDGTVTINPPAGLSEAEYRNRVAVLEVFNGSRFYGVMGQPMPAGQTASTVNGATHYTINPPAGQTASLQQAYAALKESVYAALVAQTRLKPYLEAIDVVLDESGIHFDMAALTQLLQDRYAASAQHGVEDLAELLRFAGSSTQALGLGGTSLLREWTSIWPADAPLKALLPQLGVFTPGVSVGSARGDIYLGSAGGDSFSAANGDDVLDGGDGNDFLDGGDGRDVLLGGAGNDTILGRAGDDHILGGQGNDKLYGDDGNDALEGGAGDEHLYAADLYGIGAAGTVDMLDGGAGDDHLQGSLGSQTYLFGRGDGRDTINNVHSAADPTPHKQDVLQFKAGVLPSDVALRRNANDLILQIKGSSDQVTVLNYFLPDGTAPLNALDAIRFEDGTSWTVAQVKGLLLQATSGHDSIVGFSTDEVLSGLEGDDDIDAAAGDDVLDGGAGNDTLRGGAGKNTMEGGRGNDLLVASGSQDELVFSIGDGRDVVAGGWGASAEQAATAVVRIRLQGVPSQDGLRLTLGRNLNASAYLAYGGQGDQIEFRDWNTSRSRWAQTLLVFDDGKDRSLLDLAESSAGTDQNDVIRAPAFAVSLRGGAGDDVFHAGHLDNVFEGGAGNDTLNGSATYRFSEAWGNDVLRPGTSATLDFSGALASTDVVFSRYLEEVDGELVSSPYRTRPMIRVESVKDGSSVVMPAGYAYRLQFSDKAIDLVRGDGVSFDGDDTLRLEHFFTRHNDYSTLSEDGSHRVLDGQGGDDTLDSRRWRRIANSDYQNKNGWWYEEDPYWLKGGSGNDTLYGAQGDTMEGGRGNDHLVQHWQGSFTIGPTAVRLSLGDGQDTWTSSDPHRSFLDDTVFDFAADVDPNSVRVEWVRTAPTPEGEYRLVIHYGDQGDQMALLNVDFYSRWNGSTPDTRLRFANGSEQKLFDLIAPVQVTPETEGDDLILGTPAWDVITSGVGNDRIVLDAGDTYVYRRGHGSDVIDTEPGGRIQLADVTQASQVQVEWQHDGEKGAGVNVWRITLEGQADPLWVRYADITEEPPKLMLANGQALPMRALTLGTEGDDWFGVREGDHDLRGLGGNDRMSGGPGSDFVAGGKGNDTLSGGAGDDIFFYERGDGTDWVDASDTQAAVDTLRLGEGILESDVALLRKDNSLRVVVRGEPGSVWISGHFDPTWEVHNAPSMDRKLDRIEFASGAAWDLATIESRVNLPETNRRPEVKIGVPLLKATADSSFSYTVAAGTVVDPDPWDSVIYSVKMPNGSAVPAWLRFDASTRTLTATPGAANVGNLQFVLWGHDVFGYGSGQYVTIQVGAAPAAASVPATAATARETAAAALMKGAGAPQVQALEAAAVTVGGAGNDTYVFGRGDGQDVIRENNPLENDADVLRFLDGINAEQLWLRRIEDSLEFSVLGTQDKVTISDWYLGEQHQVERFVTSDNQVLLNSQIDALVQAMASFAPPPPGQTSFTPAQQSALAPVIAANWN